MTDVSQQHKEASGSGVAPKKKRVKRNQAARKAAREEKAKEAAPAIAKAAAPAPAKKITASPVYKGMSWLCCLSFCRTVSALVSFTLLYAYYCMSMLYVYSCMRTFLFVLSAAWLKSSTAMSVNQSSTMNLMTNMSLSQAMPLFLTLLFLRPF